MVRILLDAKGDPSVRDRDGRTAIHCLVGHVFNLKMSMNEDSNDAKVAVQPAPQESEALKSFQHTFQHF